MSDSNTPKLLLYAYKRLCAFQKEYIALLAEEERKYIAYLAAHRFTIDPELINKGESIRGHINYFQQQIFNMELEELP